MNVIAILFALAQVWQGGVQGAPVDASNNTNAASCYNGPECDDPYPVAVCASDRQVYDSQCAMKRLNCDKQIAVVEWELCRGKHALCPDKCLDIYDPVCGDDAKIYPNLCIMHRRNCGKAMKVQDYKHCSAQERESRHFKSCPKDCAELYEPVCGSDGELYLNECFLRKQTCGKTVHKVNLKECLEERITKCPKRCLPIMDPVCGSDGKTYLNHCRLQEKNCGKNVTVMPRAFCKSARR